MALDILPQVGPPLFYAKNLVDTFSLTILLISGPVCAAVLLVLLPAMPADKTEPTTTKHLARIDIVGGVLSVVWAIPFVFAIQDGGAAFSRGSAVIIGTLTGGIVGCVLFLFWESHVGKSQKQDQLLPMWMLTDSIVSLVILPVMLFGFAFFPAVLLLPQRFQAVNGATPTVSIDGVCSKRFFASR